jgi:hypothetical protein
MLQATSAPALDASSPAALLADAMRALGRMSGLRPGACIGGWEILGVLGEGGMGAVYHARRVDADCPQIGALKLGERCDAASETRLAAEIRILAGLSHPGIARLIDSGVAHLRRYFLMERVDGLHIDRAAVGMPLRQRVELLRQVGEVLAYAHRQLLIHRDLKPSNVMVEQTDAGPRVRLLDFGIARSLDAATARSATGAIALTLRYAAPEQLRAWHAEHVRLEAEQVAGFSPALLRDLNPLTSEREVAASMSVLDLLTPAEEHLHNAEYPGAARARLMLEIADGLVRIGCLQARSIIAGAVTMSVAIFGAIGIVVLFPGPIGSAMLMLLVLRLLAESWAVRSCAVVAAQDMDEHEALAAAMRPAEDRTRGARNGCRSPAASRVHAQPKPGLSREQRPPATIPHRGRTCGPTASSSASPRSRFMNTHASPNWWQRNWKWFVPVGCLTTLLIMAASLAVILSLVFGLMKSSDVYAEALARARAHPAVIAALGQPIEEGWFTSGNIRINGPSGEAELSIPLSGPQGKATILLQARKSAGSWTFSTLVVEVEEGRRRIDVLDSEVKLEAE